MGIIKQFDKRTGITYVYESHSYWDKEKRMSRAKRTLIGRLDPDTNEIIPTDGRNRKAQAAQAAGKESSTDYRELYEKLLLKCASQETLINSLQQEISRLKGGN